MQKLTDYIENVVNLPNLEPIDESILLELSEYCGKWSVKKTYIQLLEI